MGVQESLAQISVDLDSVARRCRAGGTREDIAGAIEKIAREFGMTLEIMTQSMTKASEHDEYSEPTRSPVANDSGSENLSYPKALPSLTRAGIIAMPLAEFRECEEKCPGWLSVKEIYPARPGDSIRFGFWAWVQCRLEPEAGKIIAHINHMAPQWRSRFHHDGKIIQPGIAPYLRKRAWENWTPPAPPKPGIAQQAVARMISKEERTAGAARLRQFRQEQEAKEITDAEVNDRRQVLNEQARELLGGKRA